LNARYFNFVSASDRQLYTAVHNVDISQATYQFYTILNKFCKFNGTQYKKKTIFALHFTLF